MINDINYDYDPFCNKIIKSDMFELLERHKSILWLKNKSILITGAYGMIASYLVLFFIFLNEKADMNITILAQGRNAEKMINKFGKYCKKEYFQIIQEDICEKIDIEQPIDYIVHAASLASPVFYITNPVDVIKPNTLGTFHLLELAHKKQCRKILLFSSGEVYGQQTGKVEYNETDFGAFDSMIVRNCYGESKRMAENLCASFWRQYGVNSSVVRIGHTYGPTLDLINDHRVVAEFINCVVNKKNIVMKSNGTAERMFCYIVDAIDAFLLLLEKGEAGEAYNMCNPTQSLCIKELAELLIKLSPEKKLRVIVENKHSSTYIENPITKSPVLSIKKLKDLGWSPVTNVYEGFQRTLESYK